LTETKTGIDKHFVPFQEQYGMKLDTKGEIFQNLNGALEEVDLKFKGTEAFLYNTRTGSTPAVVHGNGPIKVKFSVRFRFVCVFLGKSLY
jgi:hypothetical protein